MANPFAQAYLPDLEAKCNDNIDTKNTQKLILTLILLVKNDVLF